METVNIAYPSNWRGRRHLPEGPIEVSTDVADAYRAKGIVASEKPKKEEPLAADEETAKPKKPTKK